MGWDIFICSSEVMTLSPSAPGRPPPVGPHRVWAQGILPTSPHAFSAGLAAPSSSAYSRGQQKLGSQVLPLRTLTPLHPSARTKTQCSWSLPLWIGEVLGSPGCSLALLHSWHWPSWLGCLPGALARASVGTHLTGPTQLKVHIPKVGLNQGMVRKLGQP